MGRPKSFRAVKVLLSGESDEARIRALENLQVLKPGTKRLWPLVTEFEASEQLAARIAERERRVVSPPRPAPGEPPPMAPPAPAGDPPGACSGTVALGAALAALTVCLGVGALAAFLLKRRASVRPPDSTGRGRRALHN